MAIYRKEVKQFGDSGHIVIPKRYVGKEAIIALEDEMDRVMDLFTRAYLIDSVKDRKMLELGNELKDLRARVGFIERHLTSQGSLGKKSNETRKELQSVPFEEDSPSPHSTETQPDSAQSSQQTA